jgi:hypothetical protein
MQLTQELAPLDDTVPVPQKPHTLDVVAPATIEKVPVLQRMQLGDPDDEKYPAEHRAQLFAPDDEK